MRFRGSSVFLIAGLWLLVGCASENQVNTYSPGGLQQANKADRAVVQSVRQVDVDDPSFGLGTVAGAAGGGIAGAQIGKASGNAFATLGGVLIGAGIGYFVDQEAAASGAYEYILEKPNGDLMTLAQKQDRPYNVGERVFILYGVKARIIPEIVGADTRAQ